MTVGQRRWSTLAFAVVVASLAALSTQAHRFPTHWLDAINQGAAAISQPCSDHAQDDFDAGMKGLRIPEFPTISTVGAWLKPEHGKRFFYCVHAS